MRDAAASYNAMRQVEAELKKDDEKFQVALSGLRRELDTTSRARDERLALAESVKPIIAPDQATTSPPSKKWPRTSTVRGHAMAPRHGTSSTPGAELLPAAHVNQE